MFYYDIDKHLIEEYITDNNYVYVPINYENIEKINDFNVSIEEKKVEKNNYLKNTNIQSQKIDFNFKESISKNENEIIENNINLEENMDKKENNNKIKEKDIKKKKIKEKEEKEEKKDNDLKSEESNSESSNKTIGKKRILKGQTNLDCFLRTKINNNLL